MWENTTLYYTGLRPTVLRYTRKEYTSRVKKDTTCDVIPQLSAALYDAVVMW